LAFGGFRGGVGGNIEPCGSEVKWNVVGVACEGSCFVKEWRVVVGGNGDLVEDWLSLPPLRGVSGLCVNKIK
jgi:hypothetical protein